MDPRNRKNHKCLDRQLDKGYLLRLDKTRTELFQALTCALKYENVVGEMFFGNSHTTNPSEWLCHFSNEKYEKLSVLLTGSLEDFHSIIRRKSAFALDPTTRQNKD